MDSANAPDLASDRAFPSLGGTSRLKSNSNNLDVQSVERFSKIKVSNDSKVRHVFSDNDIAKTKEHWGPTLLGVVLGSSLTHVGMESFIRRNWAEHWSSVRSLPNGVFQLRFSVYGDLNWVVEKGHWLIDGNRPLMLRRVARWARKVYC